MLHGEEGYLGDSTLTQLVCLESDEILLGDLVCLFVGLLDSSLYSEWISTVVLNIARSSWAPRVPSGCNCRGVCKEAYPSGHST